MKIKISFNFTFFWQLAECARSKGQNLVELLLHDAKMRLQNAKLNGSKYFGGYSISIIKFLSISVIH
jgi:hypothetical protein